VLSSGYAAAQGGKLSDPTPEKNAARLTSPHSFLFNHVARKTSLTALPCGKAASIDFISPTALWTHVNSGRHGGVTNHALTIRVFGIGDNHEVAAGPASGGRHGVSFIHYCHRLVVTLSEAKP
jgi:hypothetical protein